MSDQDISETSVTEEVSRLSLSSSQQTLNNEEGQLTDSRDNQKLLFKDYFSSLSAFENNMMDPLNKMFQQDIAFESYVTKYTQLVQKFGSDLGELRKVYDKTFIPTKFFAVNQAYGAFSELIRDQSELFMRLAHEVSLQFRSNKAQPKENLMQHVADLNKAHDQVVQADKVWGESIKAVEQKRQYCYSRMLKCDEVEEKRPPSERYSEKRNKYLSEHNRAKDRVDTSIDEYMKSCIESNKKRLMYESVLEKALATSQHLEKTRMELVTKNLNKYIELHDKYSGMFVKSCDNLRCATHNIDHEKEHQGFIATNTAKGAQKLAPELIILDLPKIRKEPQIRREPHIRRVDPTTDATKKGYIKIMRRDLCFRTMKTLLVKENTVTEELQKLSTGAAGPQESTDRKQEYMDRRPMLLNELDIIQVSIEKLIQDAYILAPQLKRNAPEPIDLFKYLVQDPDDEPVDSGRPRGSMMSLVFRNENEPLAGKLSVIRPNLDHYQDLKRDVERMPLPEKINTELKLIEEYNQRTIFVSPETNSDFITSTLSPSRSISTSRSSFVDDGLRNATLSSFDESEEFLEEPSTSRSVFTPGTEEMECTTDEPESTADHPEESQQIGQQWEAEAITDFRPSISYPDRTDMLRMTAKEKVTVLKNVDDNWCLAKNKAGQTGNVPLSLLKPAKK